MEVPLADISAGMDCDMSRVHRQICGVKLQVLVEGAALASTQLRC
jgi:hypothetical protein